MPKPELIKPSREAAPNPERVTSFPISDSVLDVFTTSLTDGNETISVSDVLQGIVNDKSSIVGTAFNLIAQKNPDFLSSLTKSSSGSIDADDTFVVTVGGVDRRVDESVLAVMRQASAFAGEAVVDTSHIMSVLISQREPRLVKNLDPDFLQKKDGFAFIREVLNLCVKERFAGETHIRNAEFSLRSVPDQSDLLAAAREGELSSYIVPSDWLEKVIDALRNLNVSFFDSSSDLEAELLAKTLAGQLVVAKHQPVIVDHIRSISREQVVNLDETKFAALCRDTKNGVLFLPYSESIADNQSYYQYALNHQVKLVFYGSIPKEADVPSKQILYPDAVSDKDLKEMFATITSQLEAQFKTDGKRIVIADEAVAVAIPLAQRYAGVLDVTPLDALVLIMEQSASNIHMAWANMPVLHNKISHTKRDYRIDPDDIYQAVFDMTEIEVKPDKPERYLTIDEELRKRVIGQDEAVMAVSQVIQKAKSGLKDPKRPIASLLFLGPSGVGKTELTKATASFLFGKEDQLITLDMSEYMEKHAVSRLVGAPPGYVGYEEGGQLTEAVRKHPYSVIVFDEVEKAHPDVWNMLYQVMEEGRLTDSRGRVVDFKNSLIVLTGNVGSEYYRQLDVLGESGVKEKVMEETKRVFKPAFLNRFDKVVVFRSLNQENIEQIVGMEIAKTNKKLSSQGIAVEISPALRARLAKEAYVPEYGAREVRRIVEVEIENRLNEPLLTGKISKGGTASFDLIDGKVQLSVK